MRNRYKLFSVTKKDLKIEWFSGTGKGGQNRNKHQKCCRCKHPVSGAVGVGQEERSANANLRRAFRRMIESKEFQRWIKLESAIISGEIDQKLERWMRAENLKIESILDAE